MNTINSYSNSKIIADSYKQLSSGNKINSAADNAAGLAISEKLKSQTTGYEVGSNNAMDMKNLLKTAEGGLSSINDSLLRIRELSVQAQNGIMTDSDKAILQDEVSQLLSGIKDSAKNTEFNTIKLLDGSFINKNVATNPSGSGMTINIANSSLETLGIDNYDLTGDFDISKIDEAISMVGDAMSRIGAQSNRLDSTIASNSVTEQNLTEAGSRITDTDIALSIMNLDKARIIEQMQLFSIQRQQEQEQKKLNIFGQ